MPELNSSATLQVSLVSAEDSSPTPDGRSNAIFARLKTEDFHILVSAALANDQRAVQTVFAWIRPAIVRYCRARIGRTGAAYSTADDVAQEVCAAVFCALPRFNDQPTSFARFVWGIAAHKVVDHYRRAGRDKSEPIADFPDIRDLDHTPEERTVRADVQTRLKRLLHALSPHEREILVLRVVVGLSAQETANAIGKTAVAVRLAQHRALAKLRATNDVDEWR